MSCGYHHYKEAEELIAMLHATRLRDYGDALQAAMAEGATGTEIFMALQWNLKKLLNDPLCCDQVRAKAEKLREELDKFLQ